jgi:deazaflavin-dependent oxidoreductase (nitroreductase family)
MRGLKRHRPARILAAGHAFVQNLRRGHYDIATDAPRTSTGSASLVRAGLMPRSYLLTTQGRKTGRPRTNPVVPVEHDRRRWLVASCGPVSWVHNARAAGRVTLTRRHDTRKYAIREVAPEEAGPILKRYVRIATATRRYFLATKDSPMADFVTEAGRHPVFELTPVDENRQTGQPAP